MFISREMLKEVTGEDFYSGKIIHSRFAYKFFRDKVIPIGNIIAFVSPTEVTTNLIDLEDAITKDYIYSDKMINLCWEIPLTNCWGGVAFQRLYNSLVANILVKYIKSEIEISNDDIFVRKEFTRGKITQIKGKASVSIVTEKNGAVLGHLGINIDCGDKAPVFAYSTGLTDEQAKEFITDCIEAFYQTTNSIFIATSKVI